MGPALAESWSESPDGLTYEFKLRPGLTFHNGDPCTAEDVQFSFRRYKGSGANEFQTKVKNVEVVDTRTVRFHLHAPWPDFMTYYGSSATAAGLVVPKKYLEQVGEEGFKKHPIGLGPYKFVSHTPGVELVLEAFEGYWRKVPNIKRLTIKSVPEESTRLAMLKKGEADFAAAMQGEIAEEVKRDPKLALVDTRHASMYWLEFPEQWDPKSPWADKRVRLAVNYALDRQAINEAACLGFCPPAGVIVPRVMDFALQTEPIPYDPQKASQLLAEAGYPNGFDTKIYSYVTADLPELPRLAEAVADYLGKVGVKAKITSIDRAALSTKRQAKTLSGELLPWSTPNRSVPIQIVTIINTLHHSKAQFTSTAVPELDQMIERALAATDVKEVKKLVGDMHRFLYHNAHNITIGEIHTNYAANKKIAAWNLGRNLYDNNVRSVIRP